MTSDSTSNPEGGAAVLSIPEPGFDILTSPIPNFGTLVSERARIFTRHRNLDSFRRRLSSLPDQGEEGRRKGLGLWMAGEYERASELLSRYPDDHVAAFTRAKALMSLGRPAEAQPVFERLAKAYPDEPRPRGGAIEARLEADLLQRDEDGARERLGAALEQAPASFAGSAEGRYLSGRACELARDWEGALEHYSTARATDPTHRTNLFRLAWVAERSGEDELALECYETLARMLPIDRNALMNLGVLYEDLGRDDDAAACYDIALRNDPADRRLRLYLEDARASIHMFYDEDMERKEDRLNQILRIPITDFELSVRARNCLNKMNIMTLGDLVKQTEQELLSYKNFGETSLAEIKEILASKGLRLGMNREEAVQSIEIARRRYSTGENTDVLNKPMGELELSIRARRTVEAMGCLTVGDIVQHTEDELLAMPNFGTTSLQELKTKLAVLNLKLKIKAP
jgi:DNA-directed RNA polymerase subunit alpha